MKIGYGKTIEQVAVSCWGHRLSSRYEFPDRNNAEVLAAVRATYSTKSSDYQNMLAAATLLQWVKP
jgi:hypothetical protein